MNAYRIFHKTFSLKNIKKVFEENIRNKPSIGIDGVRISSFEKRLDNELKIIKRKVLNGTYEFSFYKEKLISKGKDKYPRVISVPTIRDKIVLKLIFNFLSEIYKEELSNNLVHSIVNKVIQEIEGKKYDSFVKLDVQNFYPSIDHSILINKLQQKTKTKNFISLIKKAISQNTLHKSYAHMQKYTNEIGVPQGLSISNILASIYMLSFDLKYQKNSDNPYFRYVDDVLILCKENDIESIYTEIKGEFESLKLSIHPLEKGSMKSDYGKICDSFYFLGYKYTDILVTVREASVNKLHNSLIHIFTQYKYSKTKNIDLLYWKLNLKISGCRIDDKKYGWLFFFSQITDKELLFKLDKFIKKMFDKFEIEYSQQKIKRFPRTYYEIIKNRTNTNYIPNFDKYDSERKRKILENIFNMKNLRSDYEVDSRFSKMIYKTIKEMERDIQMY